MKHSILLNEKELIEQAIQMLEIELGPVETKRFLALVGNSKKQDSVKRHREYQKTVNKNVFWTNVFDK